MSSALEQSYQRHIARESNDGPHPDGCFYCGGDHPSQDCRSDERFLTWIEEEAAEVSERLAMLGYAEEDDDAEELPA